MTPRLSVVIVAYNSLDHLRGTLPPLMSELAAADEVIVVDNGGSDDLTNGALAEAVAAYRDTSSFPELTQARELIATGSRRVSLG